MSLYRPLFWARAGYHPETPAGQTDYFLYLQNTILGIYSLSLIMIMSHFRFKECLDFFLLIIRQLGELHQLHHEEKIKLYFAPPSNQTQSHPFLQHNGVPLSIGYIITFKISNNS